MPDSRSLRRIKGALAEAGYELSDVYYDGTAGFTEMSGDGRGWYGGARRLSDGHYEVIAARTVDKLVAEIAEWWPRG